MSDSRGLARGLAHHFVRWATRRQAPPAATEAMRRMGASLAMALMRGEICIRVTHEEEAVLLASGCVTRGSEIDPDDPRPLVLDAAGRIYLARYHDLEARLAAHVGVLCRRRPPAPGAAARSRLQQGFGGEGNALAEDRQALAAALALTGALTVISGGPGTGKTSTVLRMLICLLADDPGLRIALAAPTGKAAARLAEAIGQGLAALPALAPELRAAVPVEASTLHRLLGLGGNPRAGSERGAKLPWDVIVVDEASMIDLALATRLFDAVGPDARLILLGDKDQLAAVEPGSIFTELAAGAGLSPARLAEVASLLGAAPADLGALAAEDGAGFIDCAVWLTRTWRFANDSRIAALSRAIREGAEETVRGILEASLSQPGGEVVFLPQSSPAPPAPLWTSVVNGFADYAVAVAGVSPCDDGSLAALFAAFGRYRVLCAVREGPWGVDAFNRMLSSRLRQASGVIHRDTEWFAGRAILVTENDHAMGLFNGDVGIVLPGKESTPGAPQWEAVFDMGPRGFRRLPVVRLPPHQTAFAMTVHKAQGTEFDVVSVVLPARPSPVLTRELVYTAVTRARRQVVLIAAEGILEAALAQRVQRESGLAARLAGAAA